MVSPNPKSNYLISVPAEILLRIISYLPSSVDFLPLVQTCHGLRRFFKAHAAQIANTRILSMYQFESKIIESKFVNGWLVPTHSCVTKEEEKFLRDKTTSCCLNSRRQWLSDEPLPSFVLRTRATNHMCSETHDPRLTIQLSAPGPQYLRFLEEYNFEIRVNYEIQIKKLAEENTGNSTDTEIQGMEGEIVEMTSEEFEWRVGHYAVHKFLTKIDRVIGGISNASGRGLMKDEMLGTPRIGAFKRLGKLFGMFRRKRKLAFREIQGDKGGRRSRLLEDTTTKGLLWYYGKAGVLNCPDEEEMRLGWSKKDVSTPRNPSLKIANWPQEGGKD